MGKSEIVECTGGQTPNRADDNEEKRLDVVLEMAFDGLIELDSKGLITAWNSRAEKLFGWSGGDVIGQHVQMIVSPRQREAFLSSVERVIACGVKFKPEEPLPLRAIHRDGRRFSTELFLYPRRPGGDYRITVLVRDLSDREQLQNLLSERSEQRAILNFIEDGYTELDLQGNHQWVNDAYCRIFNRKREEVLDPSYQKITHRPVSLNIRELFKKVYATGEPVRSFEYEYGPGRFCENTISLKRGENGQPTGFVTLIRETTERKRHERELADAKDAADAANRAKSQFLANMSHEIRTPMNGIIGMTELVLASDLTTEQREFLGMVRSSAEDLLVIINDILDYSKIEAGKLALDPAQFDLGELIGDTLKSLAIPAHRKHLELAFHVDENVPALVVGDSVRLRQVLLNLAGNAVKFTDHGEVVVNVKLEDTQLETGSSVHFTVHDTGIGVPLETQQRLFLPFEQADSSTTRQYGGTGLGLAISKKIIELMGGKIWMESAPGVGSIFHFTARFGLAGTSEPSILYNPDLRGIAVLIIDDNATNRRILEATLQRWQMVPNVADSGPAGLARLEAAAASGQPFSLVLLDEQMPGMDGLRVIERIRGMASLHGVTIIMLTSADQNSSALRCRELGVDTYLIKPIKPTELFAMIQRALGSTLGTLRLSNTAGSSPRLPSAPHGAGRSLSILVAEDNSVNQRLVVAMLEKMGHRPTLAVDGIEAVNKSSRTSFDLILMDVQMPGIDGFEATRRIRSLATGTANRTPIIAMTACAMTGDRERCIEAGMDDYVSKPVTLDTIARALARFAAA
jgi:two-component system sensor histidine kinase/response regulator